LTSRNSSPFTISPPCSWATLVDGHVDNQRRYQGFRAFTTTRRPVYGGKVGGISLGSGMGVRDSPGYGEFREQNPARDDVCSIRPERSNDYNQAVG